MAGPVEVVGAEKLATLGKRLKQAGSKELRTDLYKGLARAMKPMRETAKKAPALVPGLPRTGGLAKVVADDLKGKGGIKVKRSMAGRNPGIRLIGSGDHDIAAMNRGRLRHPVFRRGRRRVWVNQQITPGWWDTPLTKDAEQARKEIVRVIDEIGKKLQ